MGIETRCRLLQGCLCDPNANNNNIEKQQYERLWLDIVDKNGLIMCICLQERDDRFLEVSQEFHKYGLCRIVTFYRPKRPTLEECKKQNITRRGGYGIWRSHRHIILEGLNKQCKRCLIWEDDVVFYQWLMSIERLNQIRADIDALPRNWGAYKFGHCAQFGYFISTSVVRTWSFLTQGVLWSMEGMKKLEGCTYQQYQQRKGKEGEIDCWMMGAMPMYATFPQLVYQSDSVTDNINTAGDDKHYRNVTMARQRTILNQVNILSDLAVHLLVYIVAFCFLVFVWNKMMKGMFNKQQQQQQQSTSEINDTDTLHNQSVKLDNS